MSDISIPEKIVGRVSKLLSVANDEGATENEKKVARKKASDLMEKWSLSEEDLKDDDSFSRDRYLFHEEMPSVYKDRIWMDPHTKRLFWDISKFLGVFSVFYSGEGWDIYDSLVVPLEEGSKKREEKWNKVKWWVFPYFRMVGSESDIENVQYLFENVTHQIESISEDFEYDSVKELRGYKYGLVSGIHDQLSTLSKEVRQSREKKEIEGDDETDLVKVDPNQAKYEKAREMYVDEFGDVSSTSSSYSLDSLSYYKGLDDSDEISLRKGVDNGQSGNSKRLAS